MQEKSSLEDKLLDQSSDAAPSSTTQKPSLSLDTSNTQFDPMTDVSLSPVPNEPTTKDDKSSGQTSSADASSSSTDVSEEERDDEYDDDDDDTEQFCCLCNRRRCCPCCQPQSTNSATITTHDRIDYSILKAMCFK